MSIEYWRDRLERITGEKMEGYSHITEEDRLKIKYEVLLDVAAEECERLRWEECDD